MDQLGGLRSHIGVEVPGALDERARTEYLGLAALHLWRPDELFRLRGAAFHRADAARYHRAAPAGGPDRIAPASTNTTGSGSADRPAARRGLRQRRALPYQALANVELSHGQLVVSMSNRGSATLQLGVYAHHALGDTAQRFDLKANGSATTSFTPEALAGA
jgi:Bacterial phospholipase C, C-terminal domain